MVKAKVFKLAKHFVNFPEPTDLKIVEEELPPIKDGEFLVEALFLSVDPYMRMAAGALSLGDTMIGEQIGKILESKNPKFPVGKLVAGYFGWRTHTISNGIVRSFNIVLKQPYVLPDIGNLSSSLFLGILGLTGVTAYFTLLDRTRPIEGETIVVAGAAGAVGSVIGQIGKIKGCKVIGIAGSDEKGKWLTKELGFDQFINYKTQDVDHQLMRAAPQGVDGYLDGVGGKITTTVQKHMNNRGRITVYGLSSKYNDSQGSDHSLDSFLILGKELKIEGFIINTFLDRWNEAVVQLGEWIKEGRIKHEETVTNGFENSLNALISTLKGGNKGKAIIKI